MSTQVCLSDFCFESIMDQDGRTELPALPVPENTTRKVCFYNLLPFPP